MKNNLTQDDLRELALFALDCMGVAVTIIDASGTLLYFNQQAAKILDRKSEYIGTGIHSHHKKVESNNQVDRMLKSFKDGRLEPFHYEAKPYGKEIIVTLAPIRKNDAFIGCVQTVRLKNTVSEN